MEPVLDALKFVLSGAARLVSDASAKLTESQTQELLSVLQQVTDVNVNEKEVFDNVLVVLEKLADAAAGEAQSGITSLPEDDVPTAVKVVEFLKNQANKNKNALLLDKEETAELTEAEKAKLKAEKAKIDQKLLNLTR